jgi:hypothetical protein
VKLDKSLTEQQKYPIEDMWDGFDRFCKVQEISGKLSGDLKEFERSTDKQIREFKD